MYKLKLQFNYSTIHHLQGLCEDEGEIGTGEQRAACAGVQFDLFPRFLENRIFWWC
jgi:hypothetical protein